MGNKFQEIVSSAECIHGLGYDEACSYCAKEAMERKKDWKMANNKCFWVDGWGNKHPIEFELDSPVKNPGRKVMKKLRKSLLDASYYYEEMARNTPIYRNLHREYLNVSRRLLCSSIEVSKKELMDW